MRAHPKDAVTHLLFENIVPVSTAWYGKAIFTPVKAADEQKNYITKYMFFLCKLHHIPVLPQLPL